MIHVPFACAIHGGTCIRDGSNGDHWREPNYLANGDAGERVYVRSIAPQETP